MLKPLTRLAHSRIYWLALIALGLVQMATALYYQYVLDEAPCLLCIHVRLWVTASLLLAVVALLVRRQRWLLVGCHALNTVIMAGLLERAWLLLGTERGTLIASCEMELGMPDWLALDRLLPALYQVQTPCGYTPKLWFGVTMAEALTVLGGVLVVISAVLTIAAFLRKR